MRPEKQALKFAGLSALLGWLLGLVLSTVPAWQIVELKVFDLFTIAAPPQQSLPITIIGIDEASFTQLDKLVALLDSGTLTQAQLGVLAAETIYNNVNLAGLALTGLEYQL